MNTVVVIVISLTVTYLCHSFNFNFNLDLTLISIAIIFPLVFTIRGSFRRREKALEHLSEFRSSLTALDKMLLLNQEMPPEFKEDFQTILAKLSDDFIRDLGTSDYSTVQLDKNLNRVYEFIADNSSIPKGVQYKIVRYMQDVHEAIENLYAIHIHRTPISLKAYCKVFIFIFPLIYAPSIINNLGPESMQYISYFVVIMTEFILISLYNIQNHLEYPFDAQGLDDIKLASFRMDR